MLLQREAGKDCLPVCCYAARRGGQSHISIVYGTFGRKSTESAFPSLLLWSVAGLSFPQPEFKTCLELAIQQISIISKPMFAKQRLIFLQFVPVTKGIVASQKTKQMQAGYINGITCGVVNEWSKMQLQRKSQINCGQVWKIS